MSNRRVYLASGDLPPRRPSASRDCLMFYGGMAAGLLIVQGMTTLLKMFGPIVCRYAI